MTADEIVTMMNVGLGDESANHCAEADRNGHQFVTVDEILDAVGNSLNGCCAENAARCG